MRILGGYAWEHAIDGLPWELMHTKVWGCMLTNQPSQLLISNICTPRIGSKQCGHKKKGPALVFRFVLFSFFNNDFLWTFIAKGFWNETPLVVKVLVKRKSSNWTNWTRDWVDGYVGAMVLVSDPQLSRPRTLHLPASSKRLFSLQHRSDSPSA